MEYDKYLKYKIKYYYLKKKLNKLNQVGGTILMRELDMKREKFVPEKKIEVVKYPTKVESKEDKYIQRKFFSLPKNEDTDITKYKLSNIGLYSFSPADDAKKTAELIISKYNDKYHKVPQIITDATANIGGDSMIFTDYFEKTISVEIIPKHCEILKNNLKVYGVPENKYSVICGNYLDVGSTIFSDIVFADPPWGGTDYKNNNELDLYLDNINIKDIVDSIFMKDLAKMVVLKVPINYKIYLFENYDLSIENIMKYNNTDIKYKLLFIFPKN